MIEKPTLKDIRSNKEKMRRYYETYMNSDMNLDNIATQITLITGESVSGKTVGNDFKLKYGWELKTSGKQSISKQADEDNSDFVVDINKMSDDDEVSTDQLYREKLILDKMVAWRTLEPHIINRSWKEGAEKLAFHGAGLKKFKSWYNEKKELQQQIRELKRENNRLNELMKGFKIYADKLKGFEDDDK